MTMLAHHHKLATTTTTTTRVRIEKTRSLGRGLSRRRVSNPRYMFFFKNYFIYLIFTPTPPTSPSLQPNLRPHQRVEAATQEWQQQQGRETWHVSSCWYVFFYFIFNLITFFLGTRKQQWEQRQLTTHNLHHHHHQHHFNQALGHPNTLKSQHRSSSSSSNGSRRDTSWAAGMFYFISLFFISLQFF